VINVIKLIKRAVPTIVPQRAFNELKKGSTNAILDALLEPDTVNFADIFYFDNCMSRFHFNLL